MSAAIATPVRVARDRSQLWRPTAVGGRTEVSTPAPGEPRAGDVVVAALRAQVRRLREQAPRVRREEPGSVTEMRVATRQLRSILRGFSRVLAADGTRLVADELKWLGAQLAEERDTEMMVERFAQDVRALPESLIIGPVTSDLERSLGRLAREGELTIMAALDSDRYLALQDLLDELLVRPPLTRRAGRPASVELPRSVAKAVRTLDHRLDAAGDLPPGPERDVALHEARKADKRLRYVAGVAADLVGGPAKRLRRQAKKLQDLLGEYQDAVVARPMLLRLSAAAQANGHNGFTYGLLYAVEHDRAERALDALPDRLARLRDERTIAWLGTGVASRRARHGWAPAGPADGGPGRTGERDRAARLAG
jgi:CHAD domain-containing protein